MNNINTYIIEQYKNGRSTYEIAEELKVYPNKINRILRKSGIPLRGKSEVQKIALASGRTKHPTEGKQRDVATKLKISAGVSSSYDKPGARENRSEISRKLWEEKSSSDKQALQGAAARAVRASAGQGSKIERYLLVELRSAGYKVIFHSNTLIANQNLQVDLFLPELKTVIEVDGLSHFEDIWGEEALYKTRLADQEKNGLCLEHFNVIRLQACADKVTGAYCRKTLARLMPRLEYIKEKGLLPLEERLIFISE